MAERKDGKPRVQPKGDQIAKSTGKKRRSTSGSTAPQVDQSNWREKLKRHKIKFDDKAKAIFLDHLEDTGLKQRSADMAGVSHGTVHNHLKNDPDFKEMYDAAVNRYNDSIQDEVVRRGRDGYLKPVYSKGERSIEQVLNEDGTVKLDGDGQPIMVPASIREYSDRLLELEAKRGNPEYREKGSLDISGGGGGVILLSGDITPEQAVAEGEAANEAARKAREAAGAPT